MHGWDAEKLCVFFNTLKTAGVHIQLIAIIRKYMTLVPTSASSERRFSSAGHAISKCRAKVSPLNIERQLFIHDNYGILSKRRGLSAVECREITRMVTELEETSPVDVGDIEFAEEDEFVACGRYETAVIDCPAVNVFERDD